MGKSARLKRQRKQEELQIIVDKIEADPDLSSSEKYELISEIEASHPGFLNMVTKKGIEEAIEDSEQEIAQILEKIQNQDFARGLTEEFFYLCIQSVRDRIAILKIVKKKYVGKTDYRTAYEKAELHYSRIDKDYLLRDNTLG